MVLSGKHRILSLSVLSIALITYLRVRLNRTLKKREELAKGTDSRASVGQSYEVFLSFHGRDTRHGFTDFLYRDMVEVGILVFRDNESLHVGQRIGDELLQAIQNSKIYVPIFSKNYASSHWCLRELAYMVECASVSNENKEIMPIFLDVEPDDVSLKTDLYSKALSKHKKKFRTEVESWKNALANVDKIKGWNWKTDESQVDLMRSIIGTVLTKLNISLKKNVTKHLVGVDDRVEAIIKMLDMEPNSVQFLGIHGMGGIGKTTLAKVIFNQLSSRFQGCNFLSDVREVSKHHGLVYLQKMLLSKFIDIHSILDDIKDVDEGINLIKRVFGNRKVLIVLDDVDGKEQLKNLAEKGDWFGSGSRIIITTRDQSVIRIVGEATTEGIVEKSTIVSTYEVCKMDFDDALKLFSKHAFRRDSPPSHYAVLSNEIVSTLGMLPLALEVTGSSLNSEPKEFWEAVLKKLKRTPPNEVQSKLMISYDKLDNEQKQVFLDIACFFVNKDKKYPFYMWDACGYHPHVVVRGLFRMSLIKIEDNDTFWMHDQVRDLGREIVRQENKDPRNHSRVWNHKDALSILKQKKGTKKLEALSLGFRVLSHENIILKHDEVANLRNLRFFQAEEVILDGDFNNLLPSLTWFSCHHCPSMFDPKNLRPTDLVILDLSWSKISGKSIDWIKEARKLKVLDLSECFHLRRTPDLSMLVSLEILILRGCEKIKELPHSIENLRSLIELDLMGTGIDHLPDSFGNLKQLTILRMGDIEGGTAKLPSAIWLVQLVVDPLRLLERNVRLSCLKMADLSWTQISGLPTVVSLVSNIHELEIAAQDSTELRDPTWTPLRELENVIFLPTKLCTPFQLEELILTSANMQFLHQLPSSLRELVFRELMTIHIPLSVSCWMPIFLGICDSELEKLHMQDYTFSRRLALFELKMRRLISSRTVLA